jgi:hypothetical protein
MPSQYKRYVPPDEQTLVKLSEKTFSSDSVMTISSYIDLGRYYFEFGHTDRTLSSLSTALYLADLVGGSVVSFFLYIRILSR